MRNISDHVRGYYMKIKSYEKSAKQIDWWAARGEEGQQT